MKTREVSPRQQIILRVLPDNFTSGDESKVSTNQAFLDLLVQRAELLRLGATDEIGFLQALTEDKEPVNTWVRSMDAESKKERHFMVARTREGEVQVRTLQDPVLPQVTVTVGLSNEGHLIAKNVQAAYVDRSTRIRPHVVEGDFITTGTSSNPPLSRQDAGSMLIGYLKNVVPYGK